MNNQEIVEIMKLPYANERVNYYRLIYRIATGEDYRGCNCTSGILRMFEICKTYAYQLDFNK